MAIVDGKIRCCTCREDKPVREFQRSVQLVGCGQCRACKRAYKSANRERFRSRDAAARQNWRARNPERARATQRRWATSETVRRVNLRRYGLTPERYDALLAAQGGRCACCGTPQNIDGRRMYVDHDHATNAVRGLLCYRCNTGIGQLGDTVEGLLRALAYLKKHRATSARPSVRINLMEVRHVAA